MNGGDVEAARGRGFARAARMEERAGNLREASRLYLRSAEVFLEAGHLSGVDRVRALRRELARSFYERGVRLRGPRVEALAVGEGGPAPGGDMFPPIELPDIDFGDVGGLEGVKQEIRKAIVLPFSHPELYELYGKAPGGGILLYGPPGTGKTYIARATAGETRSSFINVRLADVLNMYVGESEKNVTRVFESALHHAPAVVFFDELDGLAGRRSRADSSHARRLVNELLVAMDGVVARDRRVLVLAATNAPWELDPALLRPGRFSKVILVPPPDLHARVEVFGLALRGRKVSGDVDLEVLSALTRDYSCADIWQVCDEAAEAPLLEALEGAPPRPISQADLEASIEARPSSLTAWFRTARREIAGSEDADLYSELVRLIEEADV